MLNVGVYIAKRSYIILTLLSHMLAHLSAPPNPESLRFSESVVLSFFILLFFLYNTFNKPQSERISGLQGGERWSRV